MKAGFSIAAFGVFLCLSQGAQASDGTDKAARDKYQQGIALFGEGRYTEASDAFREADRIKPSWKIHYNIGQSEAAAGRYGLAIEAFERYLAEGRDEIPTDRKDYVLKELERLRMMVGRVEVRAPDGAEVIIDGVARGKAPFSAPLLVTLGKEQEVVVTDQGKEILRTTVIVHGDMTAVVDANRPEPAAEEPKPAMESRPRKDQGLDPLYVWIGIGATAAFGGTTLALNFVAQDKKDQFDKDRSNQGLKDQGEMLQKAGIAFLALTGAAAVATGLLAIFTDWSLLDGSGKEKAGLRFGPGDRAGLPGSLVVTW